MLKKPSKLTRFAHLYFSRFISIHCTIFWASFAFDVGIFLIGFSICSSTSVFPFLFIIVFGWNHGRWGTMLGINYPSKSFWRKDFPRLLIISSNSLSSSLLVYSNVFGGCFLAKGQVKTICFILTFFTFFSSSFFLTSLLNLSKVLSLMASSKATK